MFCFVFKYDFGKLFNFIVIELSISRMLVRFDKTIWPVDKKS